MQFILNVIPSRNPHRRLSVEGNASDTVWTKVRGNSSDAVRTKVQDIAMHPRHRVDEDVRPMLCERRNATMSAPIQLGQCRVTEEVCREGRQ